MTVNLSALAGAGQQFFDNVGVILSGGKLYSYAAGTTTPQATYTTAAGTVAHANPIILDSAGRVSTGEIWLTAGSNYKFVLKTSTDTTIATYDNITGINGTGIASNAVNVEYDPAGTGAVPTTVQAKLRESVSVLDFGAVGDGTTNDTTAIQACLTASAGKQVIFPSGLTYKVTSSLTVGANTTLSLHGATVSAATANFILFNLGSGCSVLGGKLVGPGNGSYNDNSRAIQCLGISNVPSAPTYVTGPIIDGVTITSFAGYGIYLQYCTSGNVINCNIQHIGYAGVIGLSCTDVNVENNYIYDISPGTASNAYGVTFTRISTVGSTLTDQPRSKDCRIISNTIDSVTIWEAIDTHGGDGISIIGNSIRNCNSGIIVTVSQPGAGGYAPLNCIVSDNKINIAYTDAAILIGGVIYGSSVVEYASNCVISNNSIVGGGISGNDIYGAIKIQATKNCVISGNSLSKSAYHGINAYFSNYGFAITGNTIANTFDNTIDNASCIATTDSTNSGYIGNNTLTRDDPTVGTYVGKYSLAFVGGTSANIVVGKNQYIGLDATYMGFRGYTDPGINVSGAAVESGTANVTITSGNYNDTAVITFIKRFPITPKVNLTISSTPLVGGKPPIIWVSTVNETGFTLAVNPSDGATWSASGTLSVSWAATV